jgi:hypothetical protein
MPPNAYGEAAGRLTRSCISAANDSACHFIAARNTITDTTGSKIDAVIAAQKNAIDSDCAALRIALDVARSLMICSQGRVAETTTLPAIARPAFSAAKKIPKNYLTGIDQCSRLAILGTLQQ